MTLDAKVPGGPLPDKWDRHRFESKLVNPANRRKYTVIIVGTGLAGASAAAALGELGYNVLSFCIQDSPRRAHSIAAQGGINAAKNYQNDGDSIQRLFYDTIKGGDYRSREASRVQRMIESDRLKGTRDSVPQVQAHDQRADHVEEDPHGLAEDLDLRAVQVANGFSTDRLIPGAVLELLHVHENEEKRDQPRPDHRR